MPKLTICRKFSVINDRAPLFVYLDNINEGKIFVLQDKNINLSEGNHVLYIKDILGFSSKKYFFDTTDNRNINLSINSNLSIVSVLLLLLVISILIKLYPALFDLHIFNGPISFISLLIFIFGIFFLNRKNLYVIREIKDK